MSRSVSARANADSKRPGERAIHRPRVLITFARPEVKYTATIACTVHHAAVAPWTPRAHARDPTPVLRRVPETDGRELGE